MIDAEVALVEQRLRYEARIETLTAERNALWRALDNLLADQSVEEDGQYSRASARSAEALLEEIGYP